MLIYLRISLRKIHKNVFIPYCYKLFRIEIKYIIQIEKINKEKIMYKILFSVELILFYSNSYK
jgi:hypothetical protein